jgi:hypothetical protein
MGSSPEVSMEAGLLTSLRQDKQEGAQNALPLLPVLKENKACQVTSVPRSFQGSKVRGQQVIKGLKS